MSTTLAASDVQFIPNRPRLWQESQVRDVCTLINGRGFKPHEWSANGLPIIRIQNLNGGGEFNYFDGSFDPKIAVESGDLLFAWSGSRGTSFGPHIWRGRSAVLNYHTWKVIPKSGIDRAFLFHALRGITRSIEDAAHGAAALVHMQKWEMEGFPLLVPPLAEQRRIAAALTDTDDLIASLQRLIAKKLAIKQGMMQELLTGRTRLPGFSTDWKIGPLRSVLTVRHGRSQRGIERPDGKYPILATGGVIGRTDTPLYSKPSVLIGRKGTIDRPQFQSLPFWTVDTLFYTEISDTADPRFVFYLFLTIDWRSMNEASGVPSLNASTIEAVDVTMPSLEEQRAIATVLFDADAEIDALERRLQSTCSIKQGMMQELLTGRTRLPVEEEVAL